MAAARKGIAGEQVCNNLSFRGVLCRGIPEARRMGPIMLHLCLLREDVRRECCLFTS
jgi:hypothetical protein